MAKKLKLAHPKISGALFFVYWKKRVVINSVMENILSDIKQLAKVIVPVAGYLALEHEGQRMTIRIGTFFSSSIRKS